MLINPRHGRIFMTHDEHETLKEELRQRGWNMNLPQFSILQLSYAGWYIHEATEEQQDRIEAGEDWVEVLKS